MKPNTTYPIPNCAQPAVTDRLTATWRKSLLGAAMAVVLTSFAANPVWALSEVDLSESQQQALGMAFAPLIEVKTFQSYGYPATLELPMAHTQWLTAPMDGLVTQLFKAHGPVKQGEPILELLSSDLLKRQELYLATRADWKVVQQEVQRVRSLVQSGVVAQKQLLATESRLQTLQQQLQQQEQELLMMGMSESSLASLKQTHRLQPAKLIIKAPADGELYELQVAVGMRLQSGAPLAHFAELDQLVAGVFVPLEVAQSLQVGQPVRVRSKGVVGEIAYISHQADPQTQRVEVHCLLPNTDRRLSAGALEQIEFVYETSNPLYELPAQAITQMEGQTVIFLRSREQTQRIRMQAVQRIDQPGQRAVVSVQGEHPADLSQWQVLMRGSAAMLSVWAAQEEGAE